jgi:protein SCO1/2
VPANRRRRCLLAAFALVLGGCGPAHESLRGTDLTGAAWGRDFSLQDPEGRTRTLGEFRGRAVMLFFGFTQCPDVCPTALARAAEVKRLLGAEGARLQVVFVTVDPERDTADLLRAYTQAFDPAFLGLRGDAAATRRTADEFKVFFEKVATGSSYTVNHTALTYAFDPAGRLRVAHGHTQSAADMASDIRLLLRQAS